jgi:hypothetical protein
VGLSCGGLFQAVAVNRRLRWWFGSQGGLEVVVV